MEKERYDKALRAISEGTCEGDSSGTVRVSEQQPSNAGIDPKLPAAASNIAQTGSGIEGALPHHGSSATMISRSKEYDTLLDAKPPAVPADISRQNPFHGAMNTKPKDSESHWDIERLHSKLPAAAPDDLCSDRYLDELAKLQYEELLNDDCATTRKHNNPQQPLKASDAQRKKTDNLHFTLFGMQTPTDFASSDDDASQLPANNSQQADPLDQIDDEHIQWPEPNELDHSNHGRAKRNASFHGDDTKSPEEADEMHRLLNSYQFKDF